MGGRRPRPRRAREHLPLRTAGARGVRDPPASGSARCLPAIGDARCSRPAVRGPVPRPRTPPHRGARVRAGRGVAGRSATGRPVGRASRRVAGSAVARAGADRLPDLDRVLARSRHATSAHARQPAQRQRASIRGRGDERDPRHLPRRGGGGQGADRADLPHERRRRPQAVGRGEGARGRDQTPRAVRHPAQHRSGRRRPGRRPAAVRDRPRGLRPRRGGDDRDRPGGRRHRRAQLG